MTGVVGHEGSRGDELVVGVDTHQDEHVAVVIDRQGVRLGELHTVATIKGYGELERWSRSLGEIQAFGIEGTGSYGAGVARFLTRRGYTVVEVNRPDRSTGPTGQPATERGRAIPLMPRWQRVPCLPE